MNTEDKGYRNTGVKTQSYSKLAVPGYTKIKYRQRPDVSKSQSEKAAMKEELLRKESANRPQISDSKRSKPDMDDLEDNEPHKKHKKEEVEEEEEVESVFVHPLDKDDSSSESEKSSSEDDSEDDDDSDDDEELAEIQRQLERIKRERAEEKAKKEKEAAEAAEREKEARIMAGNPLLAGSSVQPDFTVKKWYEETIFKNQASGEPQYKKRFINDTVRNDFHKRFLAKYIR